MQWDVGATHVSQATESGWPLALPSIDKLSKIQARSCPVWHKARCICRTLYRDHAALDYAKNDLIRLFDITYEWAVWDQTELPRSDFPFGIRLNSAGSWTMP